MLMSTKVLITLTALMLCGSPAAAIERLLTQSKALDGNVTPGDAPGFPITLSRPGTYTFAGNIFPTAARRGIEVTAPFVTIDLGGFLLEGDNQASIGIVSNQDGLTIKNGTIALFKANGIRGSGMYWTIDNMRILSNALDGILATGAGGQWTVSNSRIVENGNHGITGPATSGMLIRNNIISGNVVRGISVGGAHVEGNLVSNNGPAYYGIAVFTAGMMLGNTIMGGIGIYGEGPVGFGNNWIEFSNTGAEPVFPNVCEGAPC